MNKKEIITELNNLNNLEDSKFKAFYIYTCIIECLKNIYFNLYGFIYKEKYEYISDIYVLLEYINQKDINFKNNHPTLYNILPVIVDWKMILKEDYITFDSDIIKDGIQVIKQLLEEI